MRFPCDASLKGALAVDPDRPRLRYCDGSFWRVFE